MSIDNTLAERGARYGDFTDHALIAQELQTVMHTAQARDASGAFMPGWVRLSAVQKQALTVIADKIARILSGDPNYTDNWHDIQGYAKLAEDRCYADDGPQLPFPPVSDGHTIDTFGQDVDQHQAFHDAVVYGQGATLGGEYIPFPNERDPLAGQHSATRQSDEYFCSKCGKRWGVDESAPEACTTEPHRPDFRAGDYEMGN